MFGGGTRVCLTVSPFHGLLCATPAQLHSSRASGPRGALRVTICLRNHLPGSKPAFGRHPEPSQVPPMIRSPGLAKHHSWLPLPHLRTALCRPCIRKSVCCFWTQNSLLIVSQHHYPSIRMAVRGPQTRACGV